MTEYLFDTCFASRLLDETKRGHEKANEFFSRLDLKTDLIYVCPIVIGEIEFGNKMDFKADDPIRRRIRQEISKYNVLDIDKHVAAKYAELKAKLCKRFANQDHLDHRRKKIKRKCKVKDFVDTETNKNLNMDDNDVWIVACALTRNMTFVTTDKMNLLRPIVIEEMKMDPNKWKYIVEQAPE